jgi:hypothetical protein
MALKLQYTFDTFSFAIFKFFLMNDMLKLQICVVVLNVNISYDFVGILEPFFKTFFGPFKMYIFNDK